jgi:hypothetical protein
MTDTITTTYNAVSMSHNRIYFTYFFFFLQEYKIMYSSTKVDHDVQSCLHIGSIIVVVVII